MLNALFSAVSFLTIIPVKKHEITPSTVICFPLVGLFLGGVLVLLNFIFSELLHFEKIVIVAFILVVYIVVTGGLHLDGLSDTVDGIAAGDKDKTKIFAIMSDSHIGAEGVVAIVCDIMLKFVLLANIPEKLFQNVLLIFPCISRSCMVVSMFLSKPAKDDGVGKLFIENTTLTTCVVSTLICLAITLLIFPSIIAFVMILFTAIAAISLTKFFVSKIGGMTGDTMGAVNEIIEIFILLVVLIFSGGTNYNLK